MRLESDKHFKEEIPLLGCVIHSDKCNDLFHINFRLFNLYSTVNDPRKIYTEKFCYLN